MRVSLERGCSSSSVDTLGHVSLNSCAVKSLGSVCLRDRYPPQLQLSAWSTKNDLPQTHSAVSTLDANRTEDKLHL